jgi:beta-lactamase superfamily II metal-dependent hydrolase
MTASHTSEALRVFFLDVGQGDCTFVVPPEGESAPILFDCADQYVAERFVANHGIGNLAAVVASHFDIDHVRGMLPFLQGHFDAGRRVDRLVMFPDRVPKPARNQALRELMAAAVMWESKPPHAGFVLKASHRDGDGPLVIAQGSDWRVELVLPWVGTVAESFMEGGNDPNACSAVLRVTRGSSSVLIGGDATLASWERLEDPIRRARVIRVPHHGGEIREAGGTWSRFEQLYDAIQADLSAISVGTNNDYDHPDPAHAQAMRRAGTCRLLCTQLTPRCHGSPLALQEEALSYAGGVEWPYRQRAAPGHARRRPKEEVPCAGSVLVWLLPGGGLEVEPAPGGDHDTLLRRVDHALCRA